LVFYAGVAVAGIVGGMLSSVLGLHGWQWIFAVEGAPAIVLGVIA